MNSMDNVVCHTASALAFTVFLLTQHPEVDEKLFEECHALEAGVPSLADLNGLKHVEMVLKVSCSVPSLLSCTQLSKILFTGMSSDVLPRSTTNS
jgi:hypothetical protein